MNITFTTHNELKTISPDKLHELYKNTTANFFQTPKAISFFKSIGYETFSYAIEENLKIKAFITGIIQKEKGIKAAFSKRAIIFGGPVFSLDATQDHVFELLKQLQRKLRDKVIYIETRNLNDYSKHKSAFTKAGFTYQPHLNYHVDCSSEVEMKQKMSSSKLRQIKKSIKTGATTRIPRNKDEIKAFYEILNDLYQTKVKTPLPNLNFFIELWEQNIAKFLLVVYNNKIIGGIVFPIFKDEVSYEWYVCGKDGAYKNIYPSILATWSAMQYTVEKGIKRFDFMGAGKPNDGYGVREFKSKFGGELQEHGRFLSITKPVLYNIGKTAVKIMKNR